MKHLLRHLLVLSVIGLAHGPLLGQAQEDSLTIPQDSVTRKQFMFFSIPTVINGSRIDPSPVEAFSFESKDTKFEVKLGMADPFFRKKERYRMTLTATPYIKSSEGKSSLFSSEEWAAEYGASLGLNILWGQTRWTGTGCGTSILNQREAVRKDRRADWRDAYAPRTWSAGDTVSEQVTWLSFRLDLARTKDKLFAKTVTAMDTLVARELGLGVGYASFNFFFHSELPKYRWRNIVFSVGPGFGSFRNVADLSKRTLSEGTVVYNADSSAFTSVTKTSDGYVGAFDVSTGPAAYAEIYWPRFPLDYNGGTVSWGNRATWFKPDGSTDDWNLSSGLYFNGKKKSDGKSVDKFNFAITANWDRFQDRAEEDYTKDFFSVQLSASVPLVFN
ncbi:MAG TPA: hypothetical protein PLB89_12620 [Flavobacteriales bacterium]|nr:hypothetical protein [Flavobacteriales bacterium]